MIDAEKNSGVNTTEQLCYIGVCDKCKKLTLLHRYGTDRKSDLCHRCYTDRVYAIFLL